MGKTYTPTVKAYRNQDFLNSRQARLLRIMCEYEETMARLKSNNIRATILVFGSARAKNREDWIEARDSAAAALERAHKGGDELDIQAAQKQVDKIAKTEWMGEMHDKIENLSRMVTEWSVSSECKLGGDHNITGVTRYHHTDPRYRKDHPRKLGPATSSFGVIAVEESDSLATAKKQEIYVCTGGGPGFMEAANKGAASVPGARNMGMGITLPFEDGLNEYVTDDLAFQYHYFFTRKFWMVYYCQALIVAPGGFGTLDELFEVLTLKQTGKIQKDLPVILFGETYWKTIINWQAVVDLGTIAQDDVDSLFFTDSEEEAFEYLKGKLANSGKIMSETL